MGYLVCKKCDGHYELQEGESPKDFTQCECGGKLKYAKNLDKKPSITDKIKKLSKPTVIVLYLSGILLTFIFAIVAGQLAVITILLLMLLFFARREK